MVHVDIQGALPRRRLSDMSLFRTNTAQVASSHASSSTTDAPHLHATIGKRHIPQALGETRQILLYLAKYACLAACGALTVREEMGRGGSGVGAGASLPSSASPSSSVDYQPLLITTAERVASLVRELGRGVQAVTSSDANTESSTSSLDSMVTELLPTLHTFAWLTAHAASALGMLGPVVQEQLVSACQHVVWAVHELLESVPPLLEVAALGAVRGCVEPEVVAMPLVEAASMASLRERFQALAPRTGGRGRVASHMTTASTNGTAAATLLTAINRKTTSTIATHTRRFINALHLYLDRIQTVERLLSASASSTSSTSKRDVHALDLGIEPWLATDVRRGPDFTGRHRGGDNGASDRRGSTSFARRMSSAIVAATSAVTSSGGRRRSSGARSVGEVIAKAGVSISQDGNTAARRGTDASQRSNPPPYRSYSTDSTNAQQQQHALYPRLVQASWAEPKMPLLSAPLLAEAASSYDGVLQKLTVLNVLSALEQHPPTLATSNNGSSSAPSSTSLPYRIAAKPSPNALQRPTTPLQPTTIEGWVQIGKSTKHTLAEVNWAKVDWKERYVEVNGPLLMVWRPRGSGIGGGAGGNVLKRKVGVSATSLASQASLHVSTQSADAALHVARERGELAWMARMPVTHGVTRRTGSLPSPIMTAPLGQYATIIGVRFADTMVMLRFDDDAVFARWAAVMTAVTRGKEEA